MKLMSIASSSKGNSIFVGSENTSLLVDAGITLKRIEEGLRTIGRTGQEIDGILITHEHSDHIKGLPVIARKYGIPIYATRGTISAILELLAKEHMDPSLFCEIEPDTAFSVGDIQVTAHSVWHDAREPVCYTMESGGKKISIATDMGAYDSDIVDALTDSDALLLEANHDVRMLEAGSYPYPLKQRILGRYGHLSNEACGRLLKSVLNDHLKHVLLGHLSKDNNFPELALATVSEEIGYNPFTDDRRDFHIQVADRETAGTLLEV